MQIGLRVNILKIVPPPLSGTIGIIKHQTKSVLLSASLSLVTLLLHVWPGEVGVESNNPVAGDEEDRGDGQQKIRD